VYGFHNWPVDPPGKLLCRAGYMMATVTALTFKIYGKGGHASEPDRCIDPVQTAIDIHIELRKLIQEYK